MIGIVVLIIFISIACSISSATGTGVGAYLYSSVDGGWSEWSDGECDLDCGGERIRTRKCNNPVPFGTGIDCEGEEQEILDCSPCLTKEDIKKEAEKNALKNKNDAEKELQLVKIKQKNDADDEKRKAIEDDILTFDDLTRAGVWEKDAEFLLENLEDHRDDSTEINKIKKKISVLLNRTPRYQEKKSSRSFRIKNKSLYEILKTLRTQIQNNKTEVIPHMGTIGNLFDFQCPEDSHVTEIKGSYKGFMREFGIKCSNGESFSAPRTSKAEEGDKLATRFSYKRNNGFDKMTIHAGSIIDGIKINNNLAGGKGGAHLSKQCNNGRITGFAGSSRTDGVLSSIAIFCDKMGVFSSGNIIYDTIKPVHVPVPVPVETIVKYNTIIHIVKNSSRGHRLGLLNGKGFETTGKGEETQLVLISALGFNGEVHYNHDLVIAKWHYTPARLKMKSGKAYEIINELGDHTKFKIVGWTGKETGPVKLGDKVWIEKKNGRYQLSLLSGEAREAETDKHKDETQMNIVNF
jgi:hypothetical protein